MAFKRLLSHLSGNQTRVSEPLEYLQDLIFEVAPQIFVGSLDLNDDEGWQKAGFYLGSENGNGEVEVLTKRSYSVRCKVGAEGSVAHFTYDGRASTHLYKAMMQRVAGKGYMLANSDERSNEALEFNTFANDDFPVGMIAFFRVNLPHVTTFTVSAAASTQNAAKADEIN